VAEQVRAIAGEALGVSAEACRLESGGVIANGQRLTFGQVIQRFFRDAGGELIGHGYQRPAAGLNALGATASFWEIGLGAAVVTVDRETGAITLHRYVSLSDPGRAINPAGVEGQDLGGAMQALGPALLQAMVSHDGQLSWSAARSGSAAASRRPRPRRSRSGAPPAPAASTCPPTSPWTAGSSRRRDSTRSS